MKSFDRYILIIADILRSGLLLFSIGNSVMQLRIISIENMVSKKTLSNTVVCPNAAMKQ